MHNCLFMGRFGPAVITGHDPNSNKSLPLPSNNQLYRVVGPSRDCRHNVVLCTHYIAASIRRAYYNFIYLCRGSYYTFTFMILIQYLCTLRYNNNTHLYTYCRRAYGQSSEGRNMHSL